MQAAEKYMRVVTELYLDNKTDLLGWGWGYNRTPANYFTFVLDVVLSPEVIWAPADWEAPALLRESDSRSPASLLPFSTLKEHATTSPCWSHHHSIQFVWALKFELITVSQQNPALIMTIFSGGDHSRVTRLLPVEFRVLPFPVIAYIIYTVWLSICSFLYIQYELQPYAYSFVTAQLKYL